MLLFRDYITEAANDTKKLTHLSHLEDLMFEEGKKGVDLSLKMIDGLLRTLDQNSGDIKIGEKWDGAPSIVVHEKDGDFWVGTKSVFNKNPKLNRNEDDIKENHGHAPGLVDKLQYALKYLKDLNINGTIQGDFLYTDSDIQTNNIDGEAHYLFQPNTITYAVPVDSNLGRQIKSSKMGIVFHTYYTGSDLESMSANFNYDASKLKKSKNVFFDDANFKTANKDIALSKTERKKVDLALSKIKRISRSIDFKFLDKISSSEVAKLIAIYNNKNVKEGSYTGEVKAAGFIKFIEDRYQKEIDKLKSEKGKARKVSQRDELVQLISSNMVQLKNIYILFSLIVSVKETIVSKLNSLASMKTFIATSDGLAVTDQEGFVAVGSDNRVVKLVDRLNFSRQNLLKSK